jgi:hypothetical protein
VKLRFWSRAAPGSLRGILIETAVVVTLLGVALGLGLVLTRIF